MRFKSFNIGKLKEKLAGEDTAGAGDTSASQIAETEEPLNNKTEDLQETRQPSGGLADTANNSEEHEDAPPQPHGPLSELSVEPEDLLTYDDADIGTLLENADEEVQVIKIGAEAAAPAEEVKVAEAGEVADAPAAEKVTVAAEDDDSLAGLFSDEEDEVNPLANLINSLPDVTTQELIDDLEEIQGIINEQQR